jgi:hypothetical protein
MDDTTKDSLMNRIYLVLVGAGALVLVFLSGCATTSLMDNSSDVSSGGADWKSYADAKVFFDKIEVGKTHDKDLASLGLDLDIAKNLRTLATPTFVALFSDSSFANYDRLPPAVQKCLKYEEHCVGYKIHKDSVQKSGTGSLALRVLKFKEENIIRGFEVKILLLIHNDIVVYKDIEGTPNGTERYEIKKRPLGPLEFRFTK